MSMRCSVERSHLHDIQNYPYRCLAIAGWKLPTTLLWLDLTQWFRQFCVLRSSQLTAFRLNTTFLLCGLLISFGCSYFSMCFIEILFISIYLSWICRKFLEVSWIRTSFLKFLTIFCMNSSRIFKTVNNSVKTGLISPLKFGKYSPSQFALESRYDCFSRYDCIVFGSFPWILWLEKSTRSALRFLTNSHFEWHQHECRRIGRIFRILCHIHWIHRNRAVRINLYNTRRWFPAILDARLIYHLPCGQLIS